MTAERWIEYLPLDGIQAAPRNPKRHSPDIGASVNRFGFADGPIMDERTGRLVAGHGRLDQLKKMRDAGEAPPDGIKPNGDDWLVGVQRGWSSKSDAEADAFLVAHNKLTEAGGWDDAELGKLLASLGDDAAGLGVDDKELAELLELADPPPEVEDPGADEPPAEPVSKRGEVYALGPHRLMCGDSTSAEDVAALLGGDKPKLMVTDPPYGVNYDPTWREGAGVAPGVRLGRVEGDDRADWGEAWALFPGDVSYTWCASLFLPEVVGSVEQAGFTWRSLLVWKKGTFTFGRGHYHWAHEPCVYAVRVGATARWAGDRKQTTIWEIAQVGGFGSSNEADDASTTHGTQKPLECMERPIRNHEGDVYDPFLGSGTTLIAAARTGRKCYGMEISPAYCDVIRKRWGDWARAAGQDPGPDAL